MQEHTLRSLKLPEFKTLPRAIAIDLDGTLLDSRTQLSERNRRALERCIERGIPVVIATSRPARIFNRIFPTDLVEKCSYVLMNGAVAKGNPPLSGYIKETLPDTVLRGIIDCALGFDPSCHITLEIEGYEFAVNWEVDYSILWQRNSATPEMVLTLEEGLKRQSCKVALSGKDISGLAESLTERFGSSLSVVVAKLGSPLLNITAKTATKPFALRRLLTPHGISLDEVLAFGDDLPDVGMLLACGIPVAMANAFPEVKTICRYHTASNDEDGVALVLEKMLGVEPSGAA
jgi:Cof subfamily protein (haloacid dehalogenase superfamily)